MTEAATAAATKSIVIERVMPHPPQKVWRALTQAPLIADWLMPNDFTPEVGRRFSFRAQPMPHWNGVVNCEVLQVEAPTSLVYAWGDGTADGGQIKTVVAWTLTPEGGGTHVRMEQSGFRADQGQNRQGAEYGWNRFLEGLERVAGGL